MGVGYAGASGFGGRECVADVRLPSGRAACALEPGAGTGSVYGARSLRLTTWPWPRRGWKLLDGGSSVAFAPVAQNWAMRCARAMSLPKRVFFRKSGVVLVAVVVADVAVETPLVAEGGARGVVELGVVVVWESGGAGPACGVQPRGLGEGMDKEWPTAAIGTGSGSKFWGGHRN